MGSEFYLCAASNFSTDLYENNIPSSFTNEVPLNVGKPGEHWAVALDSLSFDKTYSNVPQAICNNSKETQMLLCADNLDSPPFVGSIMLHLNMDLVCYRTVEEVQTELMKKIPNELQTRLNVTVEQGLLNLHLNECYLYISRDMCHWLQINTDGRPEMRNSGSRYPYIEFDYRFADEQAVVVCENNNYATNIPKFIKVSMAEINPSLSGVSSSKVRDFESALVSWILEPRALLFYFNEQKFDAISAYFACVYDRFVFIPSLLQTKTVFTPSKPGRKMIKIYSRRFRLVSLSE